MVNSCINRNDKQIIEANYIKNNKSFKINKILRTEGFMGLDEEDYITFFALNKAINNYVTQEDYLVHRFVDNQYLSSVFNFVKVFSEIIMECKKNKGTNRRDKN